MGSRPVCPLNHGDWAVPLIWGSSKQLTMLFPLSANICSDVIGHRESGIPWEAMASVFMFKHILLCLSANSFSFSTYFFSWEFPKSFRYIRILKRPFHESNNIYWTYTMSNHCSLSSFEPGVFQGAQCDLRTTQVTALPYVAGRCYMDSHGLLSPLWAYKGTKSIHSPSLGSE